MSTRACVKLLLGAVVRRQHAHLTSFVRNVSNQTCTQLLQCARTLSHANIGVTRNYCIQKEAAYESGSYLCRLSGLPWQSSEEDVIKFLGDVTAKRIIFEKDFRGRFSGRVVVELESHDDLHATLEKQGEFIGTRYINVKETSKEAMIQTGESEEVDYDKVDERSLVVRVRGVPWKVTNEQVDELFGGINVKSVYYLHYKRGQFAGTLYAELETREDFEAALNRTGKHVGDRYVEIFRSSAEVRDKLSIPELSPVVKMMNVPYNCSFGHIRDFFRGLSIAENGIELLTDHMQRPLGIVMVKFISTAEANEALKRNSDLLHERPVYLRKWTSLLRQAPGSRVSRKSKTDQDTFRTFNR